MDCFHTPEESHLPTKNDDDDDDECTVITVAITNLYYSCITNKSTQQEFVFTHGNINVKEK